MLILLQLQAMNLNACQVRIKNKVEVLVHQELTLFSEAASNAKRGFEGVRHHEASHEEKRRAASFPLAVGNRKGTSN